MAKALFLDRDGIINVDHGYVHKPQEFEFVDGIFELCKLAQQRGYAIYVITNQSGIARGMYSEQEFAALSKWMIEQFALQGISIGQVYYCPHHPEKGIGQYKVACDCRKPNAGMILQAAMDHHIDLAASTFIGDKQSDMVAAERAGIGTKVLVNSRYHQDVSMEIIKVDNLRSYIALFQ